MNALKRKFEEDRETDNVIFYILMTALIITSILEIILMISSQINPSEFDWNAKQILLIGSIVVIITFILISLYIESFWPIFLVFLIIVIIWLFVLRRK